MGDGGLKDSLPLHAAIDAGAASVLAIATYPRAFPRDDRFSHRSRYGLLDSIQRTIEIMLNEVSESDRLHALEAPGAVVFIEPGIVVHGPLEVDPGLIRINYEYGYLRAYNALTPLPQSVRDLNDGSEEGGLVYLMWILTVAVATDDIAALRKEIWELERVLTKIEATATEGESDEARYPPLLDQIRQKKYALYELYVMRSEAWGSHDAMPDVLPDGTPLSHSWLKWENRNWALFADFADPFERQAIGSFLEPASAFVSPPPDHLP